ncbi:MAG: GDP-mannose 4,6-dehydratase [Planctomycetes bacterium]|nr:GDP-mannose 4,6-dehydratase [Planctomycetota bacterium]HPY75562.1 GDP-mannose 4,6-dehydratase [Planctomycetota bacterium]HQB01156.1 GDP-mannose 4,6-dehydratase [Planctomycetota bacterium]
MQYFITGGAGFIGSHLAEDLLALGHSVSVLDDLSTGKLENISHLIGKQNFQHCINTIINKEILEKFIKESDIVVHLAATVGVKLVVEHPIQTIYNNIIGTSNVLELACQYNKKLLLTSTSEVYGKSNKTSFCEDDDLLIGPPTKSRWSYACSKALDEFLALSYAQEKRLSVIICRLFNIVGPRQTGQFGMVIPRFIQQAKNNQPISVYGDGTQTRCFTYVKEVTKILIELSQNPKALGEVINIGSTEEISIKNLAEKIIAKIGNNNTIQYTPFQKVYTENFEDMQRRVPNVQKLQDLLGYTPKMTMDQILDKICEEEATSLK